MRAIFLVLLFVCGSVARADELAEAKKHFQRGTKLYDLQRYLEAAKEYEVAFELRDEPALLFNIGQAYRFAGENQKAAGAFRSYLRRVPHAPNRVEVEARIADLQRLIEEQKKSQDAPPGGTLQTEPKPAAEQKAPTITPPTPQSRQDAGKPWRAKRIAGLAVGGVGIAGLVLGITFVALASSARNDLSHPGPNTRFDPSLEDRMKLNDALGASFFAVGGAAVAAGTVLYLVGRREGRQTLVSFTPSLSRGQAMGELRLEF